MGAGKSAEEALVSACGKLLSPKRREILGTALGYFLNVRESTGWGPLRSMRELAARLERWENPYRKEGLNLSRLAPDEVRAVIRSAARRLEAGFSWEDSLEMAVSSTGSQPTSETLRTYQFLVKSVASLRDVAPGRALRELADRSQVLGM